MTDIPLADQIAWVMREHQYLETDLRNSPDASDYHVRCAAAVIATLESVPAMLAVIETAQRRIRSFEPGTLIGSELNLANALAALPSPLIAVPPGTFGTACDAPALEAQQWWPISDYPRDHEPGADTYWGPNVLLFVPSGQVAPASDYRILTGRLEADAWLGWGDDGAMYDIEGMPTHWMPLPSPPKE